ncbi:hypothetical protein DYB28_001412, partial [Aphanomyces astaci]
MRRMCRTNDACACSSRHPRRRCISVGTRQGFFVYSCEPFARSFQDAAGGIGLAEMLFSSSLIVLVGAGEQPAFSPRRLRVWNTKTSAAICDLNFVTAVLGVQLNRQRLVVVLEKKIYIFDINSMQVLNTLDTSSNPKALCVLSPADNGYLAFPAGGVAGEIVLYDAINLSVLNAVQAHRGMPVALAMNATGTFGKKRATFRRGSYPATIYSVAFNPTSTLLCCSSDTGTVHIFSLTGLESAVTGSYSLSPMLGPVTRLEPKAATTKAMLSSYLPSSVTRIAEGARDFAYARLRSANVPNLCALRGPLPGSNHVQVLVATIDGLFYQYALDISTGGECVLEREHMLRDSASEEIEAAY